MKEFALVMIALLAIGCGDGNGTSAAPPASSEQSADKKTSSQSDPTLGGSVAESDFPVPFYPGSKEDNGPAVSYVAGNGKKSYDSNRMTTASVQQVAAFYKPKLTNEEEQITPDQVLMQGKAGNVTIAIVIKKGANGTQVGMITTP